MKYRIKSKKNQNILEIQAIGQISTLDSWKRYTNNCADMIHKFDARYILIDELSLKFPIEIKNHFDFNDYGISEGNKKMNKHNIYLLAPKKSSFTSSFWRRYTFNHQLEFNIFEEKEIALNQISQTIKKSQSKTTTQQLH